MMKTGRTGLAFFFVFLATGAFAGDNGAPLEDADIATFISVWPQAEKALSKVDPEFDPTLTNALRSQLEEMAASDSKDSKLDAAAVAAGYIDFETFAATAGRILLAAQWAADAPDAGDLNAAIDAIEKDEVRTADEKAELVGSLKKAYGKALADKPSDNDIAVTKPFASAISKAIAVDE
jgi:hypothetical protein